MIMKPRQAEARPINSINRLLDNLDKLDFIHKTGVHARAWFRGHSSSRWYLEPGVYRRTFKDADWQKREQRLCEDFRVLSAGLRTGRETTTEIYLMQQHYRIPTRLLDWTTNPLAALYFATEHSEESDDDGEFYAMDAWKFASREQIAGRHFADSSTEILNSTISSIVSGQRELPVLPIGSVIPVRPDHFDRRISLQKGCFTFHMPEAPILTNEHNPTLQFYVIPRNAKAIIRRQLSLLGMDAFAAFGDFESLANVLRKAHNC